jgi:hypothetical protein
MFNRGWYVAGLAALFIAACSGGASSPEAASEGTVVVDLFGGDAAQSGGITLNRLDREGSAYIALEDGAARLARVPAGIYSVEFMPDGEEPSAPSAARPPPVIVVAPARVTTLHVRAESVAPLAERVASIEVW